MNDRMKIVSFRIPEKLYGELAQEAHNLRMTISDVLRHRVEMSRARGKLRMTFEPDASEVNNVPQR